MVDYCGALYYVAADINPFHLATAAKKVQLELADDSLVKGSHNGKVLAGTEIMTLLLRAVYFIPKLQPSLPFCS